MQLGARMAMTSAKSLPYDSQIQYLKSSGIQRIDTGIVPFNERVGNFVTIRYDFDIEYPNVTTRQLNGIQGGFYFGPCNGCWQVAQGGQGVTSILAYANTRYSVDVTYSTRSWTGGRVAGWFSCKINEAELTNVSISYDTGYVGSTALFSLNNQILPSTCKIYSAKIYANGVLRLDFVPVRVGQVGYMYDRVSGRLFGNAGSGSFTLGPDVGGGIT